MRRLLIQISNFLYRLSLYYVRIIGKVTLGKNVFLREVVLKGNINISDNARLAGGIYISGTVSIGEFTSINGPNVDIYSKIHAVEIGKFCSIARNVSIQEFNHNSNAISNYLIKKNLFGDKKDGDVTSKGPIVIGHDVWIGAHCVILSGVKIGNGAVIAANSVVTSDIPAYAIAGGSPAKVIKYRFEERVIELLEELKWWNWNKEMIIRNRKLFYNEMSIQLLKEVETEAKNKT